MACEQVQAQAPHVVFLAFPTQGHIIPAIQFSNTLASEGFIVTFMCAEQRIAKIRKSQGAELNPSIRLIGLPDNVPLGELRIDEGADSFLLSLRIADNMAPAFEQTVNGLIKDSKESHVPPPLCIISDFFVSWSQDIANKFQIPRYVFYTSPASHLTLVLYLPRLLEQGIVPVAPDARGIVIPGRPPLDGSEMPWDWQQSSPKEVNEFSFRNQLRLHESSGILINTFYELEGEAIDALRTEAINPNKVPIYPLGPILPSWFLKGEPINDEAFPDQTGNECMQWLDAQAPSSVLYVSFGSVAIPTIRQIQEIARGLDASQQAFLWILRLPPSATEATDLPEGFLSRTHSRGLIISTWAPQLLILSHPSTGGFMSHCGWNSILESICSGVPILALPQFAEQFLNSRLVAEQLRVGLKLQRGTDDVAESDEIEIAVRELIQGEEGRAMKKRARALKEEAARVVAEGGSSHTTLNAFVQAATTTHAQT
ncbi:hypothetical protein O6H91_06G139000 [Diphasiastrum complanatum]|uniref:Uncharacterized protein n=1 Tax=Diphasiastrum complanatum TaxID=34168 RepID=A0ACC2DJD1_DIPCM|nr:hypothetical protein O6H91_06G139000 [Diphasiastrum complanatum]